ncbi:hypothetical protein [Kamptonema formosum]|uniref:hypothetical protein n=1 Tax=Kamptonema formosum TaxID=331992 RepID=UPI000349C477|nr:hypothetical protein [Oscillatoria sp. PCC 10802]
MPPIIPSRSVSGKRILNPGVYFVKVGCVPGGALRDMPVGIFPKWGSCVCRAGIWGMNCL